MKLKALAECLAQRPQAGAPDWMLGVFRRASISFFDGRTDEATQVFWFQSRNFTVDLRLPAGAPPPARPLADYGEDELRLLANYEGWEAQSRFEDGVMTWSGGVSLQINNRWPEPAELRRFGNRLIEFAPSGAYVEDWRLQPSTAFGLIGLRLIEERALNTGEVTARGGGLIICGDRAAFARGRPRPLPPAEPGVRLRDLALNAVGDSITLASLFDYETSVGYGDLEHGFSITHSTRPDRYGQDLTPIDGFEPDGKNGARQTFMRDGVRFERIWAVDAVEPDARFSLATQVEPAIDRWFDEEAETISRYLSISA